VSKIAKRYAKAMLDIAHDQKVDEFNRLEELFAHKEAQKALFSPVVPIELKEKLVTHAAQGLHPKMQTFFNVVVRSRRVYLIPQIIEEYKRSLDEKLGIHNVKVTSVTTLSDDQLGQIRSALSSLGEVRLEFCTEPGLMGGFRIETNNKVLDLSLKTKLNAIIRSAQKG
jgi:F-type H+-transporting ATPase subunit delta